MAVHRKAYLLHVAHVLLLVSVSVCSAGYAFNGEAHQNKETGSRSGKDIYGGFLNRMGISPTDSLWIGSHKINWSPLPLFLQFTSPNGFSNLGQQQVQPEAQSRSFSAPASSRFRLGVTNDPYNHQQLFSFTGGRNLVTNVKKVTTSPAASASAYPPMEKQRLTTPPSISSSTAHQPIQVRSHSSGPSSSSSSPLAVELSTPGPELTPIVERLREMTEWTRQKTLMKKEGRYDPFDHKGKMLIRRKHIIHQRNDRRGNVDEIIVGNQQRLQPVYSRTEKPPKRRSDIALLRTSKKSKSPTSDSEGQASFRKVNKNEFVIIHPSNAAYLIEDPLKTNNVQENALRRWELGRREKKMGMFQSSDAMGASGPPPASFRFGPQDAKANPYSVNGFGFGFLGEPSK